MKVLQQKMQICRATPTHRSAKREFSEKGKSVGGGTEKHAFRQELFNGLILHANN